MVDIDKLRIGDKVHYIPSKGADSSKYQNGMVKEIPDHTNREVRVVYHCNGEWDNFKDYTSALTDINMLETGWYYSEEEDLHSEYKSGGSGSKSITNGAEEY